MAENVAPSALFNPTVERLITGAFRDLGVVDDYEELPGTMYDDGLFRLQSLVKTMEATGIHVWTEEEAMLFLQPGIPQYVFSGAGTAQAGASGASMVAMCADADNWVSFELLTSYPAGASVLTLDVPAALLAGPELGLEGGGVIGLEGGGIIGLEYSYGINPGDNFGVVLDDGPVFWTTVAAVVGPVVTLAGALPSSASQGNATFDFAPGAQVTRPLMVPRCRLLTYSSMTEIPMTRMSRQEYMDLPQKLSPGTPTQFFYSPQRGVGRLYFWSNPAQAIWGARFTQYRALADLLAPNNTMDFPQEWMLPLRQFLAKDLLTGYSVPPAKAKMAIDNAAESMAVVLGWDRESEDVQFGMDWQFR